MQRCLVETAFALLKPIKHTILTDNAKLFVIALLRVPFQDLNRTLSAMLVKEQQEQIKLSIEDGTMDFDNSNPPTPNLEETHQQMKPQDFTGVRDLFSDFTFNRKTNEKLRAKEINE